MQNVSSGTPPVLDTAALARRDADAATRPVAPIPEPDVALAPPAGSSNSSSIGALNDRLQSWLDEGGTTGDPAYLALEGRRDLAISTFTGNPDPSAYDPGIAATAQASAITYNAAVDENARLAATDGIGIDAPADGLPGPVRDMPWERGAIASRVEALVADGVSPGAAAVYAMTERGPAAPGLETRSNVVPTGGSGDWPQGFAALAARSGDELRLRAAESGDPNTATYTSDSGRIDVTMDGDTLVISDGTPGGTRRIDPTSVDRIVIQGSGGDDVITVDALVTAALDIAGGAGDDLIYGGAGADRISGGSGNDTIFGGDGDDAISGGSGSDNLEGNGGRDRVDGGSGADYIAGGDGRDFLDGGLGRDSVYGGADDDLVLGGSQADYLDGGQGTDLVFGQRGDDLLSGGAGDDFLIGGDGGDRLIGASGTDRYLGLGEGDHVIAEGAERVDASPGSGATVERLEIDPDLGASILVDPSARGDFRSRVDDDLETLRATNAGQSLLGTLDDTAERTGNSVYIGELQGIDNAFAAPLSDDPSTYTQPLGGPAADGVDTLVGYNVSTNIPLPGTGATPPVVVLFHELVHAHNITSGTLAGGDYRNGDDITDTAPIGRQEDGTLVYVPNAERQAVGLPLDHDGDASTGEILVPGHRYDMTENGLRTELGLDLRTTYLAPRTVRWLGGGI